MSRDPKVDGELCRRGFLGTALMAPFVSAAGLWPSAAFAESAATESREPAPQRLTRAMEIRREAAARLRLSATRRHRDNGDAAELGQQLTFSKALPHDGFGRVDAKAMRALDKALASQEPNDFEKVPLGGKAKLANPQAAFSFDLIGPDASSLTTPPPPKLTSRQLAAEMVELYWQALLRDVAFADYAEHPLAIRAVAELSGLAGYGGPREDGRVTPELLFRGPTAGDRIGPYISQFLLKDILVPPITLPQKIRTCVAGDDYLGSCADWLEIQNGANAGVNRFDPESRYLRNGRDLAEYVHRDIAFQGPYYAALMLLKWGVPVDGGNPYKHSRTQASFTTFGAPYMLSQLTVACQVALSACWYQKWVIHRRLRPEEVGGLVENQMHKGVPSPLEGTLFESAALAETVARQRTGLLTSSYPEGCPIHPSYPSGHAVISGAGVTVLKAFFDENALIPDPKVPTPDGSALEPYRGKSLTVGHELDKLASNLGLGRNFAGIHWRSDLDAGLVLGEEVAIEVLRQFALTGNELFSGFSLRRFDGTRLTL